MAVLASGALTKLVRNGLVRHQAAVQALAPPLLPSVCIISGGFVARIGMAPHDSAAAAANDPSTSADGATEAAAATHNTTSGASDNAARQADDVSPADYEFVISAINMRATLLSRFDVAHRLSTACVAYDAALRADVEAGFKRAQLSALLQDAEVADIVREVHEGATVAWLHPGDGDALLAAWQRIGAEAADDGEGADGRRMSTEDARCALLTWLQATRQECMFSPARLQRYGVCLQLCQWHCHTSAMLPRAADRAALCRCLSLTAQLTCVLARAATCAACTRASSSTPTPTPSRSCPPSRWPASPSATPTSSP